MKDTEVQVQVLEKKIEPKWWHWYDPSDSPAERKLVMKLDLLIVPYTFMVWWVQYLDQTNLNNAYVSGLKEDLGFYGNELVYLQVVYVAGAVIFQIPFGYYFPKCRMDWLVPALNIGFGVFTLVQYKTQSFASLMIFRFFIGVFQGVFFPAIHYVLGAWYKGHEIHRRGGLFYLGLPLGALTASLLQSSASKNLDGVNGLTGWRWMFITSAIPTIPLGFFGLLFWPGTPQKPSRRYLSEDEILLAKSRLGKAGHQPSKGYNRKTLKKIFTSWHIYAFVAWDVTFWNATPTGSGSYLLWLKALDRYSIPELNKLSAIAPGLGFLFIAGCCFGADFFRSPAGAITVSYTINAVGLVILIIWTVPEGAMWFAQNLSYSSVAISSVLYGWANHILRHDEEERAFVLIAMNTVAQTTNAWVPLLTLKTVEAPRFRKGFSTMLACALLNIAITWLVFFKSRKEERRYIKDEQSDTVSSSTEPENVIVNLEEKL